VTALDRSGQFYTALRHGQAGGTTTHWTKVLKSSPPGNQSRGKTK